MRATLAAVLLVTLMGATDLSAREPQRAPEEARARVQHHLQEVDQLTTYFEGVMGRECPRFGTPAEWREYLDGEVERVVLLLAHLEQAWVEAKSTGDDDVRRTAKAPRRRAEQARALLDKLSGCASGNGAKISQNDLWRRIEREVPQRQAEIALPSETGR
jgi:outer membrane biogenesis lipoprotein LolB